MCRNRTIRLRERAVGRLYTARGQETDTPGSRGRDCPVDVHKWPTGPSRAGRVSTCAPLSRLSGQPPRDRGTIVPFGTPTLPYPAQLTFVGVGTTAGTPSGRASSDLRAGSIPFIGQYVFDTTSCPANTLRRWPSRAGTSSGGAPKPPRTRAGASSRRRPRGCGAPRRGRLASTPWRPTPASPARPSTSRSARAPGCSTRSPPTRSSAAAIAGWSRPSPPTTPERRSAAACAPGPRCTRRTPTCSGRCSRCPRSARTSPAARSGAGSARGRSASPGSLRRLSEQGRLRTGVGEREAADLLWVLTSFEAYDLLRARRDLDAAAAGDALVGAAERGLLR